ncbi:hypothetical protein HDV57DRAFT_480063 [Trichoderma longibrachiatum]|uniref:Uncharacterized protein n=1 Tax=Trichoderma longibrachiatum ATCC 18648 TaxID=983965 RepID=A0A2T4CIU3_TRILO|nr:hypothetical protein M440DRAFT_1396618 [Trichoderma longibrachiatum ATCC 18648]
MVSFPSQTSKRLSALSRRAPAGRPSGPAKRPIMISAGQYKKERTVRHRIKPLFSLAAPESPPARMLACKSG